MDDLKDKYGYSGRLTITLKRDGKIIDQRHVKNVLLNTGRDYLIQRIMDDTANVVSGTAVDRITVGTTTSGGVATGTDTTATDTEIGRAPLTYASGARGACSATATFDTGTAVGAITEAGLYAGGVTSGDGVFFSRVLFAAINKTTSDVLQIKWDVSFTGAAGS